MTRQSFEQASAFAAALGADVLDFRAIHDTRKDISALTTRGTVADCWQWIVGLNEQGYGIFAVIAAMDGQGLHLQNVHYLRANYVDLDEGDARQQYERTLQSWPLPWFAVQSSPDRFHVYWVTQPYTGNERFELIQRKLRQVFNGDRTIIDATRVMRLPGTLHLKDIAAPHLVQCWSLPGYGQPITVEQLETALQSVNVIDGGAGERHELGDAELAAPSVHWLEQALTLSDPNKMDRYEWIAFTAAFKQAGTTLLDPDALFARWSEWCGRYSANDPGENLKQWRSIRNSELGWQSLLSRVPSLRAVYLLQGAQHSAPTPGADPSAAPVPPMPEPPPLDCSGEYLTHLEQQEWFKGCTFVINRGEILTPKGRFLNATKFNAAYGGKHFIIDGNGKKTNEPWQAATRSTLWTVPKVDHTRFIPSRPHGEVITDELDRAGVNVYRPATIRRVAGDASPFLRHVAAVLPNPGDQRILLDYLAHNIKYPGEKIAWAPVIQSVEGAGKGVMKLVMRHAMARPYFYTPKASELASSGAQFNAWLRHRLFILVDEVKVDERRELIEVLKPLISEDDTEVQGKGVDQDLEDNFSNWLFFTNWKDAIPINKNGRRFAIMYSAVQTVEDLIARGMDDAYFIALYDWLMQDGAAIVAQWFADYPIARGALSKRAPLTSSTTEALAISRSPIERTIAEAVEDALPGFRGGYVSAVAVVNRVKALGVVRGGSVTPQTVDTVLQGMGYRAIGRAVRPYFQEDRETRAQLYARDGVTDVALYGRAQGWE